MIEVQLTEVFFHSSSVLLVFTEERSEFLTQSKCHVITFFKAMEV